MDELDLPPERDALLNAEVFHSVFRTKRARVPLVSGFCRVLGGVGVLNVGVKAAYESRCGRRLHVGRSPSQGPPP